MSDLKPCPLPDCDGNGESVVAGFVSCAWADCELSYVAIPIDAWQALPRQSEGVRGIAAELYRVAGLIAPEWARRAQKCASRLESLAPQPAPVPGEVWVRQHHNRPPPVAVSSERQSCYPYTDWHGPFPVHGSPPQDGGEAWPFPPPTGDDAAMDGLGRLAQESAPQTTERTCGKCGQLAPWNEIDPCLGMLPRVANACCGHGNPEEAYIQFENGVRIAGFTTIEYGLAVDIAQETTKGNA